MAKVSEAVRSTLTSSNIRAGWGVGKRIEASFKDAGVEVLGAGQYGAVIRDNGNVVKIFAAEERGYGFYLSYLKGKSSTLHPRVKTVGTFGKFTCVQIEPLVEFNKIAGGELGDALAGWIDAQCNRIKHRLAGTKTHWKMPYPKAADAYVNKTNLVGMLEKFMRALHEHEQEYKVSLCVDIHAGNFMLRDNGDGTYQFVLTDPLC